MLPSMHRSDSIYIESTQLCLIALVLLELLVLHLIPVDLLSIVIQTLMRLLSWPAQVTTWTFSILRSVTFILIVTLDNALYTYKQPLMLNPLMLAS